MASTQKRILLVDDDPEILESMRYCLEGEGYEVLVARDGNQGVATATAESPDLVILDMMMPKRSGFLVLEKLIKDGVPSREGKTPMQFIMITANEGNRHEEYARMLGVTEYIRKPFAMDALVDAVHRLVGEGAGAH